MTTLDAKAVLRDYVGVSCASSPGDELHAPGLVKDGGYKAEDWSAIKAVLKELEAQGFIALGPGQRSGRVLTDKGWAWLIEPVPVAGLQGLKRWSLALAGCERLAPMTKVTALAIREYAHAKSGTVYVGTDKLEAESGLNEGNSRTRRGKIVEAGWLVPTGEAKGRTEVYSLTIPRCECANCAQRNRVGSSTQPRRSEAPTA